MKALGQKKILWTFVMRRRLARMVLSCSMMIKAKNTLLDASGLSCGQRDLDTGAPFHVECVIAVRRDCIALLFPA